MILKALYEDRYRQTILFLSLFQTCGIRLFSGIGILLSLIIFFLCIKSVRPNLKYALPIVIVTSLFLIIKGMPFSFIINCEMIVFNAFLLIEIYKSNNFIKDLYKVLTFLFIHGLMCFVLAIVIPDDLWININGGIPTQTLGYLFYRPLNSMLIPGVYRLMGLAWEPGCMQLFLNLLLFLKIKNKEKTASLLWCILAVILTGSTVGYFILMVNALYYVKSNNMKKMLRTMWILFPFILLAFPFIETNIVSKMGMSESGSMNSSGVIRYRDFYVGLKCLINHLLTGIDMSNLTINPIYQKYEYEAIESITGSADVWYDCFDYTAGGYTNGLFTSTMLWGIGGIYLLYNFTKSRIWRKEIGSSWIYVPLIFCLTFISEPITNTVFFYFIAFFNLCEKGNKTLYLRLKFKLK